MEYRNYVLVTSCILGVTSARQWPAEDYALPMSVYGCPDNKVNDWKRGYLNITFNNTVQLLESSKGRIGRNESGFKLIELLGPYGAHSFQFNFCGRVKERNDQTTEWPRGPYSIYGTRSNKPCPAGFKASNVSLLLPKVLFYNRDGFLPDMNITIMLNNSFNSVMHFIKCQRNLSNDEDNNFKGDDFDISTILLTHDELHVNDSDAVTLNKLYFETERNIGRQTGRYDWISYYTITKKEMSINIVEAEFVDKYIENSTVLLYATEISYSKGIRISALGAYANEDPWVLYNIGVGAAINAVIIRGDFVLLSFQDRFAVTPEVHVSEMKWSFLDNGAQLCIKDVYTSYSVYSPDLIFDWILVKCMNKLVGRYVTLTFSSEMGVMQLPTFFYLVRLVQFVTQEKSQRCSHPLGMRSGAILDVQLSASSANSGRAPERARPREMGWCSANNDFAPFYQIDFVASVRVEGLELHSPGALNSYYGQVNVLFTFSVEYGMNISSLQKLPNDFTMILRSPPTSSQTILFASTVKTRFLRIYPRPLHLNIVCLEFEVIGCQIPDPYSRECTENAASQWFPVNDLYIPQQPVDSNVHILTNASDFLEQTELCYNLQDCYAVSVSPSSGLSEMFLKSHTYSFTYDSNSGNDTKYSFLKLCGTDDYLEGYGGYMSSFNELFWGDKTRANPGILVSPGYPLYYPSSAVFLWTINVDEGQYVSLLFSNITLHKFKGQTVCEETIYLYPYPVNTFMGLHRILQYIEYGTLEYHPHDSLPMIVTNDMNNMAFAYHSDSSSVTIVFRTCSDEKGSDGQEEGLGFRLLAYASEYTTCLHWGFHFTDQEAGCYGQSGELSSMSFAGFFFENSEFNMWTIIVDTGAYITLQVIDFDVGCETGTIFEITNVETATRYCNQRRPVYPIVSDSNRLEVKFHVRLCGSTLLVEGFKGRFTSAVKNDDINRLVTSEKTGTEISRLFSKQVCSETLNSCYVMLDLENYKIMNPNVTDVSWNYTMKFICGINGWSMVSIHSKTEEDFVVYYLQQRLPVTKRYFRNSTGYYGYVYLGLSRKSGESFWNNGSPVTYTSWASGHPSRYSQEACTRLSIRSASADIEWESVSCGNMMADYAVCEYPMIPKNESDIKGEEDFQYPTLTPASTKDGLDMSVYFDCGDGEIISMLGRCNGQRDCISGSDENFCAFNSTECSLDQFRCKNGQCLDMSLVCDFHEDCLEGDDENCEFPTCSTNEFRCKNQQCIDGSLLCDGKPDCLTGEDEYACSSCNTKTSFNCGDYSCIPLSCRCDGVPDCQTELEEKYCTAFIPNTCQEWYNVGYRENGMYKIYGEDMECDFSEIKTTGKIITKYHSIDYQSDERKRAIDQLYLHYGSEDVLDMLSERYECLQTVDELCEPWIQELYEVDQNGTGGQNKRCECIRWTYSLAEKRSFFKRCDGGNASRSGQIKVVLSYTKPFIESLAIDTFYYGFVPEDFKDLRLRINPIVCYTDFEAPPPDIVCGNGMTAPLDTSCLYNETEFGTIFGCRNLAHLQNCENYKCPDGFYKCPSSFCLENRFVCDGEDHCEHGEDEQHCGVPAQVCVNQYRCLSSNICLSYDYLCDGIRQCPLGDDERLCNFSCPHGCRCKGLTLDCRMANMTSNDTFISDNTKLIDISSNSAFFNILARHSENLYYLSFLNISSCNISEISGSFFESMKNLLVIDMSYNKLQNIRSELFIIQHKLNHLFLGGNTEIHTIEPRAFAGLHALKHFELNFVHVKYIAKGSFDSLNLDIIDLSYNTFDLVDNEIFNHVDVGDLFLNGTVIHRFEEGMLQGIAIKNKLITDAYKFCCIKPPMLAEENCYPQKNEFSSCSDLMRNDALRALLWIIGLFSLLGNGASLFYRFIYDRNRLRMGYGIFVSNLAIADFLMGIYLIIIASADVAFRGTYIYRDEFWRFSVWCKLAGVLSTISSEASVLFICLITLDRIFVIKYPFGQIRFTPFLATVASCIVWSTVLVIGILPIVITSYFQDTFYSKSGVCLALPLTRDRPSGWEYSISIFIGFNFVTFLAIAFGQWMIYTTINHARSKMKSFSSARSNDLRVARNLLFVASTDFLCWFPVGILGILALANYVIPGEVYAWTAVLVLPINSALNPFLYTLSAILGRTKFAPDTSEQTRTQVTTINLVERHYDVWKCRLFVQPALTQYLLPLASYMKDREFRINKCLCTVVTLSKCIQFLHDRDVSTSELSLDNLFLRPSSKGSFSIALSLKPTIVQKESEKQADINKYGKLVDAILKSCKVEAIKTI